MGCRRPSSLLVAALLVSLLTHRIAGSCARHVAVLKVNSSLDDRGDTNLANREPASGSADDLDARKGFEGWKHGARNMEEAEAMGVIGDRKEKADIMAESAAARRRRPASSAAAAAGSRSRTVEMRAAGKHADPATEMYDMLRRDYASRASRRRPINNGEPLQDEP